MSDLLKQCADYLLSLGFKKSDNQNTFEFKILSYAICAYLIPCHTCLYIKVDRVEFEEIEKTEPIIGLWMIVDIDSVKTLFNHQSFLRLILSKTSDVPNAELQGNDNAADVDFRKMLGATLVRVESDGSRYYISPCGSPFSLIENTTLTK